MLKKFLDEKCLPPREVSAYTKIPVETSRDHRRLGLLDGVGEQGSNGRWKYSATDCVVLWMATHLAGPGRARMDFGRAVKLSSKVAVNVMVLVADAWREMIEDEAPKRLTIVANDDGRAGPDGLSEVVFDVPSLADFDCDRFDRVEVINSARLAEAMPSEIKSLIVSRVEMYREQVSEGFDPQALRNAFSIAFGKNNAGETE